MKIGIYFGKFILTDSKSGGGYTFQQSILNVLQKIKSNHEFYVFADDADKFEKNSNIKFVKLERYYSDITESFFLKNLFRLPRKVKRYFLKKNYKNPLNKAVLENKIEFMWFVTPAFEFVEIPYIYTVWDLQHRLQSYFPEVSVTGWKFEDREERYNLAIKRAAYIIIGNQAGKKEIINFYGMPEERIKTLALPTPDFVLNNFNYSENIFDKFNLLKKNYLFYPAQFWPHKNHILILLALRILKEKYNLDFNIVFTGSDKGNLNYIKQKTKELNLENKVYFLNFVEIKDLINLYKNAFALVFPSFFGPDNIPPLESFALKCPVIAAKVSGSQYQLKDAALLFDPKSEIELAEKIKELYESENLRNSLIQKGFEKAASWDSQNYLENIISIINSFEPIRRCWSSKEIYRQI